jgi:hypothetical protein
MVIRWLVVLVVVFGCDTHRQCREQISELKAKVGNLERDKQVRCIREFQAANPVSDDFYKKTPAIYSFRFAGTRLAWLDKRRDLFVREANDSAELNKPTGDLGIEVGMVRRFEYYSDALNYYAALDCTGFAPVEGEPK